jgi:hypothetical protein
MPNEQITSKILEQLSSLSLRDQVEVLANVLMFTGVDNLVVDSGNIAPDNIAKIVLDDRISNGETIANALALQGLTMMLWLENK